MLRREGGVRSLCPTRFLAGLGVLALVGLMTSSPAHGFLLYQGNKLRASLDTTLTYGLQWRVQGRDEALIGAGNGGQGANPNWDDGDLNYNGGLISNLVNVTSELDVATQSFGLFLRGTGFYDFENTDGERARYSLSEEAKDQVGRNARLLDAYAWGSFDLGSMPAQIRVGEQVVNWGESTFIPGGIGLNTINPIDITKLRTPGADLRQALLPEGMVWGSLGLSKDLSVEGLYAYDWEETHLDEPGTYFSTVDFVGDAARKLLVANVPDNKDASAYDTFLAVPRAPSEKPDNGGSTQGQFGVALRYFANWLHGTEFSFYYMRYDSKLPIVAARTGTVDGAVAAGTIAAAATPIATAVETHLAANPGDISGAVAAGTAAGTGAGASASASQAIAATAAAGGNVPAVTQAFATNAYAKTMRYRTEYAENINLFGLGFNTEVLGWGLQGELSHRLNVPLQIDDTEILFAALSPIDPSGGLGAFNQIGNFSNQFDTWVPGEIKRDTTQVQFTVSKLFGPMLGAAGSTFVAEAGWLHVHGMPSKKDLRLEVYGPYGTGNQVLGPAMGVPVASSDHFADADSMGYVLYGQLDYDNAIGPVGLSPRIAWSQDVHGTSPNGGPFIEGRKAVTLALQASYLENWTADLGYTNYFGAGDRNLINDRDFISFDVKYRF